MTRLEWIDQNQAAWMETMIETRRPGIDDDILPEITFSVQSKTVLCSRCKVAGFDYFFLQAPDGTELEGVIKPDNVQHIKTQVCDGCLLPDERERCDAAIAELREASKLPWGTR